MQSNVTITVVVPIYNVEDYLDECLQSLVEQSTIPFEVLLVDDGSTDKSPDISMKYTKINPELFHYYRKSNGGLSDARNYGIERAKGDYILFLDSDDYLVENAIERIVNLISNDNADIVEFDFMKFYESGRTERVKSVQGHSRMIDEKEYLIGEHAACNKVVRREIFENYKIRFPKGLWYEDRATTGQYVVGNPKIQYFAETLYCYRQREASIMHQSGYNPKMMDIVAAVDMAREGIDRRKYRDEIEYIYIGNLIFTNALRLLPYKAKNELKKCINHVNEIYPNWTKNKYFKRQSKGYQLVCVLLKFKMYTIATLLINVRCRS